MEAAFQNSSWATGMPLLVLCAFPSEVKGWFLFWQFILGSRDGEEMVQIQYAWRHSIMKELEEYSWWLIVDSLCFVGVWSRALWKVGILSGSTSKKVMAPWKVPCLLSKLISGFFPAESVNGSGQDVYFVWSKWMRGFQILEQNNNKKSLHLVYRPDMISAFRM